MTADRSSRENGPLMIPLVRRFIHAALFYLALGATLGLLQLIPATRGYLLNISKGHVATAHAHLLLVGFVSMTIFGMTYHVVPRFHRLGREPYSLALGWWHFWLSNLGLLGLTLGLLLAVPFRVLAIPGSALLLSFYLFIFNTALSMRGPDPRD